MNKSNQSLVDFLQTLPLSSFGIERNALNTKEAQILYNLWSNSKTDEYGRLIIKEDIDPMQIASLTSKGYIRNYPNHYIIGRVPIRSLELTSKAKEAIRKIILRKEKSSFNKESSCRIETTQKIASREAEVGNNWLMRTIRRY